MFNLGGGEIVGLVLLALIILGPQRLPEYAARLAHLVRDFRQMAEGAKSQIREEMGPAFDDVDWRQLDPRQYDPRRIVREALATPAPAGGTRAAGAGAAGAGAAAAAAAMATEDRVATGEEPRAGRMSVGRGAFDPTLPVPFDVDAT